MNCRQVDLKSSVWKHCSNEVKDITENKYRNSIFFLIRDLCQYVNL